MNGLTRIFYASVTRWVNNSCHSGEQGGAYEFRFLWRRACRSICHKVKSELSFLWFLVSFVPDLTCSEFFQIIALLSNVWTKKKMAHFWTRCANWVILDVIQGWLFEWLNRRIAIGAKPGSVVAVIMFLSEWLLRGMIAAWLKQWEPRICCRPVWLDCEDFTGQSYRACWRQGGLSCVSCCGDGRLEGINQRLWKLIKWKQ